MRPNVVRIHGDEAKRELGIVSGIPLPRPTRPCRLKSQIAACNVGDSFLTKINRSVCYFHAKALGVTVRTRPERDGYIRVWRIA